LSAGSPESIDLPPAQSAPAIKFVLRRTGGPRTLDFDLVSLPNASSDSVGVVAVHVQIARG
jgi:hypothetical protein